MTRNRVYDQENRAGQPTLVATTRGKCFRSTRRLRFDFSIAIDFEECHGLFTPRRHDPLLLPFADQVKSTAVHSLGAIEGVRRGVFSPDMTPPPESFAALKKRIADTRAALEVIEPAEIDAFLGRDMRFAAGERRLDFTAENFLLSFSQPNFYFHAATTYDILRWKGVRIGKRDFTGRLRTKPIAARD